MGFWQRYRSSLKPFSVEEPIDIVWHRLLGYGVARAALPTPISADAITVAAIVVGVASGVSIAVPFEHHLLFGALLCTFSAVLDCADGQVARLRKTSSNWGRMLDGTCDLIVMTAVVIGSLIHLRTRGEPWWFWPIAAATIPCCTFHFGHYDHYKNVFLRLTEPTAREGEDLETALARRRASLAEDRPGLVMRSVWRLYIFYISSQNDYIHATDPYTSARLGSMPPYDAHKAAIYRKHALGPMRLWRTLFGLGTHVFTFSLALAFDRLELYVLFRFGLLNLLCYGVALPWQRRASKAAFEELELRLPDQRGWGRSESPAAA